MYTHFCVRVSYLFRQIYMIDMLFFVLNVKWLTHQCEYHLLLCCASDQGRMPCTCTYVLSLLNALFLNGTTNWKRDPRLTHSWFTRSWTKGCTQKRDHDLWGTPQARGAGNTAAYSVFSWDLRMNVWHTRARCVNISSLHGLAMASMKQTIWCWLQLTQEPSESRRNWRIDKLPDSFGQYRHQTRLHPQTLLVSTIKAQNRSLGLLYPRGKSSVCHNLCEGTFIRFLRKQRSRQVYREAEMWLVNFLSMHWTGSGCFSLHSNATRPQELLRIYICMVLSLRNTMSPSSGHHFLPGIKNQLAH